MEIPLRHSALLTGVSLQGGFFPGESSPELLPHVWARSHLGPGGGRASIVGSPPVQKLVWCHQQEGRPGAAGLGARRRVQTAPQSGSALATFFPSHVAIQTFLSQQDYNSASQRSR